MQASSVNATQLLSSFLGNEHEKIGQNITKSDFAGELKKLMPAPAKDSSPASNAASQCDTTTESSLQPPADARKTTGTQKSCKCAKEPSKTSTKKDTTDPNAKIKNLKTRAKNSEQLFIANPAMIETILADLQYPAETIQAYKALQGKDGMISVKDLKSVLERQPGPVGNIFPGKVSAEQAQVLVGAIVAKEGGQATHKFANAKAVASLGINPGTSYTATEFRGLIDRVLQTGGNQGALAKEKAKTEGQIVAQASINAKTGQTESLASRALPSFAQEEGEGKAQDRAATATGTSPSPEREAAQTAQTTVSAGDPAPHPADGASAAAPVPPAAKHSTRASTEANTQTAAVSAKTASTATVSESVEVLDAPENAVEELMTTLEKLNGKIVSSEAPQPSLQQRVIPVEIPAVESGVAQAQNLAATVKEVEKQADRTLASELATPRDFAEAQQQNGIKTYPAHNDGGRSADSQAGDGSDLIEENRGNPVAGQSTRNFTQADFTATIEAEGDPIPIRPGDTRAVQDPQSPSEAGMQHAAPEADPASTGAANRTVSFEPDAGQQFAKESKPTGSIFYEGIRKAAQTADAPAPEIAAKADSGLKQVFANVAPQTGAKNDPARSNFSEGLNRAAQTADTPAPEIAGKADSGLNQVVANVAPQAEAKSDPARSNFSEALSRAAQTADTPAPEIAGKADSGLNQVVANVAPQAEAKSDPARSNFSEALGRAAQAADDPAPRLAGEAVSGSEPVSKNVGQPVAAENDPVQPPPFESIGKTAQTTDDAAKELAAKADPGLKQVFTENSGGATPSTGDNASKPDAKSDHSPKPAPREDIDSAAAFQDPRPLKSEAKGNLKPGASVNGADDESGYFSSAEPASAHSGDAQNTWYDSAATFAESAREDESTLATAQKLTTANLGDGKTQFHGHETTLAAKEMTSAGNSRDAAPEWTMVQNGTENFQGARIDVSRMQNSTGNAFAYYDPYHAVELAQSFRDASSTTAKELVLEIDPEELGKMSIKVGAKQNDITATIVTENESAKQVLVKSTPELRQDFQDQGLSLGKFMVDVNRERAGGGSAQEGRYPEAASTSTRRVTEATDRPVRAQSTYRPAVGNSHINIFA